MQTLLALLGNDADDHPTPPVDDLLLVYLGQSCGSRAPEPARRDTALDPVDLWDYLGDFA